MDVHSKQVQDAKKSCNFQVDRPQESTGVVLSVPCEIKRNQDHTRRTKCVPKCKREDRTNCSQANDCVSTHHWMATCLDPCTETTEPCFILKFQGKSYSYDV